MNSGRLAGTLLTLALTASLLAACGNGKEETAAVCDDVGALRTDLDSLKSLNFREGDKVSDLMDVLDQVRTDVGKLVDDATSEFATEIDAVKSDTDTLAASVEKAVAAPSAATLSAVTDDVQGLGAAFKDLQEAVADTC